MAYEKLKEEQYNNLGGINQIVSTYKTPDTQFLNLRNYTFVRPGALTSRAGIGVGTTFSRATFITKPANLYQFLQTSGASFRVFDSGSNLYTAEGPSLIYASLSTSYTLASVIDFQAINDRLYFVNGTVSGVFNGSLSYNYRLGQFTTYLAGAGITFNTNITDGPTATIPSGTFAAAFIYARGMTTLIEASEAETELGFERAGGKVFAAGLTLNSRFLITSRGSTLVSEGRWVIFGFTVPPGSAISLVVPALARQAAGLTNILYQNPVGFYLTTSAGVTMYHAEFDNLTVDQFDDFKQQSFGFTVKYAESYNNFLFWAGQNGSSNEQNTVYYSNLGEPDASEPENFFQVKSTFGDVITGLAEFQDALIIFKGNSMYELRGSSEETFQVRELSVEFGCLNNKGVAQFENKLWFIDKKGIAEYDGSNIKIVSEPIGDYLDLVDKSILRGFHLKSKNQVWFCAGQRCFVYDYFVKSWTIFDNVAIDAETGSDLLSYGSTTQDISYFVQGASVQSLARFNDSLNTDFGSAITLIIQTRFHKRLGESTQEIWRRLFIDSEVGSTQGVTIRFYSNYSDSASVVSSLNVSSFQERIDFGISAKSLSVEFIIQSSQSIIVNGYTLESRYLRSV